MSPPREAAPSFHDEMTSLISPAVFGVPTRDRRANGADGPRFAVRAR
jgi:hypothetical protein